MRPTSLFITLSLLGIVLVVGEDWPASRCTRELRGLDAAFCRISVPTELEDTWTKKNNEDALSHFEGLP